MTPAQKVRKLVKKFGSQAAVATEMGVSAGSVGRWVKEETTPARRSADRIRKAYRENFPSKSNKPSPKPQKPEPAAPPKEKTLRDRIVRIERSLEALLEALSSGNISGAAQARFDVLVNKLDKILAEIES